MWDGHSNLRNNAKMYIELNKKRIFLWILNKKVTLCHETSLNQIYRNVLESKQRMRQLPILTQTFVPDIAARWKMRKCTGRRLKCWIQTKIFIKYQQVLFYLFYFTSKFSLMFLKCFCVLSQSFIQAFAPYFIFTLPMIKFNIYTSDYLHPHMGVYFV